jgi:hypothetical protein
MSASLAKGQVIIIDNRDKPRAKGGRLYPWCSPLESQTQHEYLHFSGLPARLTDLRDFRRHDTHCITAGAIVGALRKTLSARLIGVFEAAQEGARGL